jgi:hypothetical protein
VVVAVAAAAVRLAAVAVRVAAALVVAVRPPLLLRIRAAFMLPAAACVLRPV